MRSSHLLFPCILPLMLVFIKPTWPDVQEKRIEPFEIVVHVASEDKERTLKKLKRLMESANEHFYEAGIAFQIGEKHELQPEFIILETIRERRQLKKFFVNRTINLFLVDEILDPNPSKATKRACAKQGRKPSGRLGGAHVPIKGQIPGTYIILSRRTDHLSLAHELGHFFGVPHHKDPENIMSYGARRNHFDKKQIKTFLRSAKRFRRTKSLKTLSLLVSDIVFDRS